MKPLVTRIAALHQGLWEIDPRYRGSWHAWPTAAALGSTVWLLTAATSSPTGGATAPWGIPATSSKDNSAGRSTPPAPPSPASADIGACKTGGGLTGNARIDACSRALTDANLTATDRSELYFQRGFARSNLSQMGLAIEDYTEALRIDPNKYWALNNRGAFLLSQGRHKDAIADLDKAITVNPNGAYALTNRAEAYWNLKEYDKSIADASAAVRSDPNYIRSSLIRGRAYYDKGEFAPALRDFDSYLNMTPNDTAARHNRAAARIALERFDEAITDANEALRIEPRDAEALSYRCSAYFSKNDLQQAEQNCNEALRIAPKLWYASEIRGRINLKLGRYPAAIDDFNAIPAIQNRSHALEGRARAFMQIRKNTEAETDLEALIRLQPRNATAYNLLGYVGEQKIAGIMELCNDSKTSDVHRTIIGDKPPECWMAPNYDHVLRALAKAMELDPDYAAPLVNRGRVYLNTKRLALAIADFSRALQLSPRSTEAYLGRGSAAFQLDDMRNALDDFNAAIQIDPRSVLGYYDRAQCFLKLRDRRRAIDDLRAAVQIDPGYAPAKSLLRSLGQKI
jgi:tetratricopeptide (TPR) repeat protein